MKSINLEKKSNILTGLIVDDFRATQFINECIFSVTEQDKKVDLLVAIPNDTSKENEKELIKILSSSEILIKKPIIEQNEEGQNVQKVIEEKHTASSKLNFYIIREDFKNFPEFFNFIFNVARTKEYEYVSFIEQEDVVAKNWFKLAHTYAEENPSIGIFLPVARNTTNSIFNGFMNEASWVEGFAEEAGKADITMLQRFNFIHPLGALYKIESVLEFCDDDDYVKPMKESMNISHYYEFFLRMIYNDIKIMTIPRWGYDLRFIRKEIFNHSSSKLPQNLTSFPKEKGGVTQEEVKFWMELAQKEYFFEHDRNKTYEQV